MTGLLYRLWQRLLRRSLDARTRDTTGCLTAVAIFGAQTQEPAPWPRCGVCGVVYSPRPRKLTCLTCERGHHPTLGKLIVQRNVVAAAVAMTNDEPN